MKSAPYRPTDASPSIINKTNICLYCRVETPAWFVSRYSDFQFPSQSVSQSVTCAAAVFVACWMRNTKEAHQPCIIIVITQPRSVYFSLGAYSTFMASVQFFSRRHWDHLWSLLFLWRHSLFLLECTGSDWAKWEKGRRQETLASETNVTQVAEREKDANFEQMNQVGLAVGVIIFLINLRKAFASL